MKTQETDITLYGLSLLAAASVMALYWFDTVTWFIPFLLVVWSLLSLSRLISLTTPFQNLPDKGLPNKILSTLGFKKQEQRENVLIHVFMHPHNLLFIILGVAYLGLEVLNSSFFMQDHLTAVFWGSSAALNVRDGSFFMALQNLFLPFLCGILFILFQSLSLKTSQAKVIALCFMGLCLLLALLAGVQQGEEGMSGYMMRASAGGFWLASLPYILAVMVLSVTTQAVFDGFQDVKVLWFASLCIFVSMVMADMIFVNSAAAQSLVLMGWIACGVLSGPVLYKTRDVFAAYSGLKERLDFRTKIEHS